MPFEDSLIGNDDFDPKVATESLVREVTKEPLPADLSPRMLNTRLARKLNEKPGRIDYGVEPKQPAVQFNPADVPAGQLDIPEAAQPTTGAEVKFNPADTPVDPVAPAETGYVKEFGKAVVSGVKGMGASALKGVAGVDIPTAADPTLLDDLSRAPTMTPAERAAVTGKVLKGISDKGLQMDYNAALTRVAGGGDAAAEIAALKPKFDANNKAATTPVTEAPLYKAGQAIEDYGKGTLAPSPGWEKSWTRDIGAGAGSMLAGIPLAMIPGVGPYAAGTLYTTAGMGEAVENAVKEKATPEQIRLAARFGGVAGATDLVDALLPTLGSTGKALAFVKRVGIAAVKGALMEGGQEGVQQLMQNAIAKGIYKPDQDIFEDVPRSMAVAAILGGVVGGGGGALSKGETAQPAPGTTLPPPGAAPGAPGAAPGAGTPPPGGGPAPEDVSVDEFLRRAGQAPQPPPGTGADQGSASARMQDPATMSDADLADAFHQARTDMGGISLEEILKAGGYAPSTISTMDERGKVEEAIAVARAHKAAEAPKTKAGETPESDLGATEAPPGATAPPPGATKPPPVPPTHAEYATLREYGYSDQDIANMPPTQRSREVRDAKDTGIDAAAAMKKHAMPAQPAQPTGAPVDRGGAAGTRPAAEEVVTNPADQPVGQPAEQPKAPPAAAAPAPDRYAEAEKLVQDSGKASTSYIQRKLGLNYNEAATLVERLEQAGVVGPADHTGKRDVLKGNVQGAAGGVPGEGADLKPASSGPVKAEEAGQRPLTEAPAVGAGAPKGAPPTGEVGGPGADIPETPEGSVQKSTLGEQKPVDKEDISATAAHHTEIETALGPDADLVLPVDANRAAQILAENPGMPPETAFGQAVAENAVEQGYIEEAEAKEIYGPNIEQVLEAGRPVAPEGAGLREGEGAKAEEAPEAGEHEAGVVPGGGKAGEAAAAEAGAAEREPDTAGGKPDTVSEAGGVTAEDVTPDIKAADFADQVDTAWRRMEAMIDAIEAPIEAKNRPGVSIAADLAQEYWDSVPAEIKAEEPDWWKQFPSQIKDMRAPGYVTAKQQVEAEEAAEAAEKKAKEEEAKRAKVEAKKPKKATPAKTTPVPAETTPAKDEISDIWDDILGPEEAAPAPAAAPSAKTEPKPRTTGEAGKAAATKVSKGAMEALKGLDELFSPKGKLGSGPTFDDETYAKAKPFFKKAAEEFAGAWKDMKEFAGLLAKALQDHMGWTMDRLRQLRPYLEQFTRDVRDGIVKFAKGAPDERVRTEEAGETALDQVPAGEGPAVEGERPVGAGAPRGGEPRPGRDRGAPEEGLPGARGPRGGTEADTAAAGGGGRRAKPRARREGGGVSEESAGVKPADGPNIPAINFRITDELGLGQGSEAVKFRDNIAAIELVQDIEAENRRATPDEQKTLARYVGWGGLANAFRDTEGNFKDEWRSRGEELERLLSPEELVRARASTRNAHYTSKAVVDATWKAVKQLGFKGGLVLEPSAGSGNFLGLIPEDVAGASKFVAVEYDPTTARIAKLLYPNETVLHSGFHQVPLADGEFTLAIGNPPFGNESLRFQFKPAVTGHSIHNQFFLASLDALRPGGVQAMVVSRYLMDAQDPKARIAIALKANLLGAIRLPDTAFKENARTQVVTDILFLQRHTPGNEERLTKAYDEAVKAGKNLPWEMEWVHTTQVRDPLGGEAMHVNKYFAKHSNRSMIVGQLERSGSMYGKQPEVNVSLPKGADFEGMLNAAVERLPSNVMDFTKEVLDATAARHKGMSEALEIAMEGHEPGHVTFSPDGKMLQVMERETPSGSFEATRRLVTPDSPWSRTLTMDKDGNWYSMEASVDPEGKKVKSGKRNVYVRKYYPDNKVPGNMKLGDVKFKKLGELVSLRDLTKRQLVLEAEDAPAEAMEGNRAKLAAAYNGFVAQHGLINDPTNLRLVNDLPDGALIASLESGYREAITTAKAAKTGQTARPATAKPSAIMSRRVVMKYETPTVADSPSDALAITLSEMGRANMDRIASLLGKTPQEAIGIMTEGDAPLLYHNPEAQTYEPPNIYLSGNVRQKLLAAQHAGIDKNVAALTKVQPARWDSENVTAIIGSNWIPPKVYADFVDFLIGGKAVVNYSPATNAFSLVIPGRPDRAKYEAWGTREVPADQILAGMLNSRVPKVMREDAEGKKSVDQEASALVAQKAREIENEFADWVFQDSARRNQLVDIYNDKFNTKVTRQHDGSHLTLPGKVPDQVIKMRRHQLNAIWRGIYEQTMLLDHVVGAGKTFTAIARAMERRRMGLSKKPTIVVPNHLVDQWAADVYRLYPAAKVLAAGKNQFDSKNRRRLFAKIATGDWDIVIIPHSSFGFIGIAPETEQRFLDAELALAMQAIKDAEAEAAEQGLGGGRMKPFTVKQAEALAEKIRNRMDRLKKPKERMLTFEQMGIDDLTVDEAHEFKNLFYSSRLTGVSGMGNPAGSEKAFDLYNKIRAMRENPNATVTFMTGTPISNSAVEMYTMMRYLMPKELKELGLEHFDAWRTQSVSAQAKYEPTSSGGLKEVTRLGRTWSNMRSLMELYYGFTDAVSQDDINKAYAEDNNGARFPIPKVKGGKRAEVVVKPTPEQTRILMEVVAAFNALPGISNPQERNAARLRLEDRARKVSLDARAVDPTLQTAELDGKLDQIADNVARIHAATTKDLGTQLIFLDRSVPKGRGDTKKLAAYDELLKKRDDAEASGDEQAYRRVIEALDAYNPDEMQEMRLAQTSNWNAYDQLKENLIARGIPANEIRHMKEVNNDLEKKALFDSVNAGEVRVLIGSTQLMGAGTNVQERIVGLHHGDVTWKPSDIEQREGRIIRQGNELLQKYGADNFEVEILAYVTERTIDAKMWDLNATKLRMINGIRNYDGSFNMEFADEDAVGMAEIAALASGDPMLMERVKLQSEIEKTELLARAHRRKQTGIEDTIEQLENATKTYPGRIERGQADAKLVQAGLDTMNAAVEARTLEFNGTTYTHAQRTEARTAIEAAIDEQQAGDKQAKYLVMVGGRRVTSQEAVTDVLADALGDLVPIEAVIDGVTMGARSKIAHKLTEAMQKIAVGTRPAGTIAGLDLVIGKETLENGSFNLSMTLERDGRAVVDVERTAKQIETAQVRALFDKLYAETKDTAAFTGEWMQSKIDEAAERLPQLQAQRGKPFADAEKLKGLRDRLDEVTAILDARTKEAEGRGRPAAEEEEEPERASISVRQMLPAWTAEEAHAITDAVIRLVRHRVGDKAAVRFLEGPILLKGQAAADWALSPEQAGGVEAIAYSRAWSRLIGLSLRPDIARLAGHEIEHFIEDLLMTDHEREVVKRETPMLRERIKPYAREAYNLSPEHVDAIDEFEVRAIGMEMYDKGRLGEGVHVGMRRWFQKVLNFLRDMAAALRRAVGRERMDDIYRKIYAGGFRNAPFNPAPGMTPPPGYRAPTFEQETAAQHALQGRPMIGPLQPADVIADRLLREFMAPVPPKQPLPPPAKPGEEPVRGAIGPGGRTGPPLLPETIEAQLRARSQTKLADVAGRLGIGKLNPVEWRTKIQDKFIRIRNVEQSVPNYMSALSTYQAEALSHGRTGERLEDLEHRRLDPLVQAIHDAKFSLGQINALLYARHAFERNAWIDTFNPAMNGEGSGMSNAEATAILSALTPQQARDFDRIGAMVDAINAETRATLVQYGLISQETADAWNALFRYYVPLRGFAEASENDVNEPMVGLSFDQRARVTKDALGRQSLAEGPLQYVMMQAESAIVRGERNKVGNTMLRFVQANPNPARWQVDAPELKRRRDPQTGMVTYYADFRHHLDPSAFVTRIGGKPSVIRFWGHDGQNIARALKGMETPTLNGIMRGLMTLTTIQARLNTQWNPEFILNNFFRDMGEAFINLNEQQQQHFIREFARHIGPALPGIMRELRNPGSGGVYGAAFREFDKAGGRVRFFGMKDPADVERNITKRMRRLEGGPFNTAMNGVRATGDALEIVNTAVENATRLAAYMAARSVGMSIPESAMLGRNVTVDFNRKGEWGSVISTFWMFGGARLQGTARMGRALQHKKVRRAVYGLAAIGALSALYSILAGGDDDDGESYYTKIPSWVRDKNMIIMWPKGWGADGAYAKLPVPFGFAPFYVLGARALAVAMGKDKPSEAAWAFLVSAAEAFNPVGEESSLFASLLPSLVRPAYHILMNQNWTGKPLYPDRDYNKQAPDSSKAFRSTSEFSKRVASGLNAITGGSKYQAGWVDVHPGSIDHVIETITGGVGRFANGLVKTGGMALNGEFDATKAPILRRFVGTAKDPQTDAAAYYKARDEAEKAGGVNLRAARKDMGKPEEREAAEAYIREHPKAAQGTAIFKSADEAMKPLRAMRERAEAAKDTETVKRTEERMRQIQNEARKRYKSLGASP